VQAKEPTTRGSQHPATNSRPLLLIDIDGVISLFGFPAHSRPAGSFHTIDGIPHFLSTAAAQNLLGLVSVFDPVWCSGWEEKADEYLPHLLGVPAGLPFLSFERDVGGPTGARPHWKLDAIDAYAGLDRPLAWVDDAFNNACHTWAHARPGPTLLVQTAPHIGLTEQEAAQLREWAPATPR
jgi:hypothetical protein